MFTVTDDGTVNLNVGPNTITITVTAEDTTTTETYTVTVMRDAAPTTDPVTPEPEPSDDATLSGLTLSGVTLSPAFAAGVTSYTADVANTITSVTVTATTSDDGATVTVTGDGAIDVGPNTITITVTAEDTTTTATYIVTVTRAVSSDATLSSLTVNGRRATGNAAGEYTIAVSSTTDTVTVVATPNNSEAMVGDIMAADANGDSVTATGTMVTLATTTDDDGMEIAAETIITFTVTAADATTADYTLTITISDAAEVTPAAEASLPTVTRAIVGQISNAISGRINSAVTNSFNGINLASLNNETTIANFLKENENINLKNILNNNDFVLPLNANKNASGISSLSLWASGGFGGVNDDHNTADWDGDYSNANIGLDAKVSDDLLIGLALSSTTTDIDYKDSAMPNDNGKYQLNLTGVHPYIAYTGNGVTFSASIGEADGELEIDNETKHNADLKTVTIAAGIPLSSGNLQPNLTAELTESELSINDDNNTKTNANTAKINVAIAPTIGRLQSNLQLGINFDTGDGKTGTAAEFRAGIAYDTGRIKTTAELHLIDGDREWGISGSLRLSPGNDGQGLSLTMQPTYSNKMELTTHLAYGIGKVTPYLNATTNKTEYGLQWQPTKQAKLKLLNEKTKTDNAIKLTTEINF